MNTPEPLTAVFQGARRLADRSVSLKFNIGEISSDAYKAFDEMHLTEVKLIILDPSKIEKAENPLN